MINVLDMPGHANFAGEVNCVLLSTPSFNNKGSGFAPDDPLSFGVDNILALAALAGVVHLRNDSVRGGTLPLP